MKVCSADITKNSGDMEMIGLLEFSRRMGVCANTIRNWIEIGKISAGEHYLHVGNVYRFPWSIEFVEKLMKHLTPKPVPRRPRLKSRTGNQVRLKLCA